MDSNRNRLTPSKASPVKRALARLKTAPLLNGYRGSAPADIDALVQCVLKMQNLIEMERESILEIEVNPLMVKSVKNGAIVADALVILRAEK